MKGIVKAAVVTTSMAMASQSIAAEQMNLDFNINEVKATIEKNGKIVESKTYKDVEKLALYVEDILGINKGSISNFTSMHPRLFKSNDLTVAIVPINKAERKVVIKKNNTVNGA